MKMIIEKAENGYIVTHEGDTKYVCKTGKEMLIAEFAFVSDELEDGNGKIEVVIYTEEVNE